MVKNLTEGKPLRLIFSFFIPIMLCNLLQQIYNLADMVIVGRYVGANALAAVGSTGSITFLFLGFLTGVTTGCAVPVARHFGAKQYTQMRKAVANTIHFSLIVSVLLTAITLLSTNQILILMRFPADIFEYSKEYLIFSFAGIICTAFYNLSSALLRAVGDSRTPLISLVISCVVNIALNILFVKMGLAVIGVALATLIAQFLSVVFCTVYIFLRLPQLVPKKGEWKLDKRLIGNIAGVGIPMGLQSSVTAIGSLTVQSAVNTLGTLYVTAVTASGKVSNIFTNGLMESVGITMVTYCSQNIGAQRIDRIKRGVGASWVIMAAIVAGLTLVYWFLGGDLTAVFLRSDEPNKAKIIELARYYLGLQGCFLIPLGSIFIFRNSIQGLGFSTIAMLGGFLEMIARVLVSLLFVKPFGFHGVAWANPLAWLAAGVFFPIIFIVLMRKIEKRIAAHSAA